MKTAHALPSKSRRRSSTRSAPLLAEFCKLWQSTLILSRPSRPREQIGSDIASGVAELEAFGQIVLANPDFVERLKTHAAMKEADRATYFGGTAQGYTDYPAMREREMDMGEAL